MVQKNKLNGSKKDPKNNSQNQTPQKPITQHEVDEEIGDSFPASDPPSWTLGSHRKHKEPKKTDEKKNG